jgi:hypothetical protein
MDIPNLRQHCPYPASRTAPPIAKRASGDRKQKLSTARRDFRDCVRFCPAGGKERAQTSHDCAAAGHAGHPHGGLPVHVPRAGRTCERNEIASSQSLRGAKLPSRKCPASVTGRTEIASAETVSIPARTHAHPGTFRPDHPENGMEKVEEYKRMALEAREKAKTTRNENLKRQLLQIADEWDALAKARLAVLALRKRGTKPE